MNPQCEKELSECKSLKQMIDVLNKYYNLDQELGSIAKSLAKSNIPKIVFMLNIKKR